MARITEYSAGLRICACIRRCLDFSEDCEVSRSELVRYREYIQTQVSDAAAAAARILRLNGAIMFVPDGCVNFELDMLIERSAALAALAASFSYYAARAMAHAAEHYRELVPWVNAPIDISSLDLYERLLRRLHNEAVRRQN